MALVALWFYTAMLQGLRLRCNMMTWIYYQAILILFWKMLKTACHNGFSSCQFEKLSTSNLILCKKINQYFDMQQSRFPKHCFYRCILWERERREREFWLFAIKSFIQNFFLTFRWCWGNKHGGDTTDTVHSPVGNFMHGHPWPEQQAGGRDLGHNTGETESVLQGHANPLPARHLWHTGHAHQREEDLPHR